MDKRFKNKPVFKEKFLKLDFKVKLSEARAQLPKFEYYMCSFIDYSLLLIKTC